MIPPGSRKRTLGPRAKMRTVARFVLGLLIVGRAAGGLNLEGVVCGENRCSTVEYCNRYVKACRPCSSICDVDSRNYQPDECLSDCQEYLHDKRYVLLKRYEDLRGEVGRLRILVSVAIGVALFSLPTTLYLMTKRLAGWKKLRAAFRRTFLADRVKETTGNDRTRNNNNNNNNNNNPNNNNNNHHHHHRDDDAKRNKGREEGEIGTIRQNGGHLRLTMPTISASVAPARVSVTGIENGTPNTTSTSISGRHPSEDTTLDYAYDNPAMTPSPESVQIRTNRESSF
ncbi:uncharacterized protein LOC143144137 [Ptiloglossa arizonensis]|uniref:uncharacterized protein LOC143144137 n=1 Tax=Ptiloglossa arizonensis TaxID=3350558 RepID=UPI003F9F742A